MIQYNLNNSGKLHRWLEMIYKKALYLNIILILLTSCVSGGRTSSKLTDFLPRETDVPGWEIIQKPRLVKNKDISARNPIYGAYNPKEMASVSFRSLSQKDRIIHISLIRFRNVVDAFGMYSREKFRLKGKGEKGFDNFFLQISRACARIGEYCMLLSADININDTRDTALQFLKVMESNLKDQRSRDELPGYLGLFSPEYSVEDVAYYREGHQILEGMPGVFVRARDFSGTTRLVLFKKTRLREDSKNLFDSLITQRKDTFSLSASSPFRMALRKREGSVIVIGQYRAWIFGILDNESLEESKKNIFLLFKELKAYTGK